MVSGNRASFTHNSEVAGLEARVSEPGDGRTVVGFYPGHFESAHVDMDDPQAEKTAIHERLHQLSDPGAEQRLGKQWNEGITEDLAIKERGKQPNSGLPPSYPQECANAQDLRRICGDDAVNRSYLSGDCTALWKNLDRHLGRENLDKLGRIKDAPAPQEHERDDAEE